MHATITPLLPRYTDTHHTASTRIYACLIRSLCLRLDREMCSSREVAMSSINSGCIFKVEFSTQECCAFPCFKSFIDGRIAAFKRVRNTRNWLLFIYLIYALSTIRASVSREHLCIEFVCLLCFNCMSIVNWIFVEHFFPFFSLSAKYSLRVNQ